MGRTHLTVDSTVQTTWERRRVAWCGKRHPAWAGVSLAAVITHGCHCGSVASDRLTQGLWAASQTGAASSVLFVLVLWLLASQTEQLLEPLAKLSTDRHCGLCCL